VKPKASLSANLGKHRVKVSAMESIINNFAKLFGAELRIGERLVVKMGNRLFLLDGEVRKLAGKSEEWLYAGIYLGRVEDGKLHPSFPLLSMIAEKAKNRVTVDDKTAWLFICGRDIFREGILEVKGSGAKGAYTLVFNRNGECLGFGRIAENLDYLKSGLAIENLLDIGDFLRRERRFERRLNP